MTSAATVAQAPPPVRRERIMRGPVDTVVTVVLAALLAWVAWRTARFVFVTGDWEIIRVNLTNLLVGLFPRGALWRPTVGLVASVLALAFGVGATRPIPTGPRPPAPTGRAWLSAVSPAWPLLLLVGVLLGLTRSPVPVVALAWLALGATAAWAAGRRVPRRKAPWAIVGAVLVIAAAAGLLVSFGGPGPEAMGGLLLTLWLALAGILLSFPFGVLLALGRRSELPAVRLVSAAYIELTRGVPLVALLFMGAFVIPLLLPPRPDPLGTVSRALASIVLFTAAYVAEIVRGGLQSVPSGQVDAALAVGLPPLTATRLIVLPQALRAVIPPLVGQFITLFKDTSLVVTIGLLDLLGMTTSLSAQPQFLGSDLQAETLAFASLLYWVGAYSMSRASRRLEARLGVGGR
jgi:general L-amino acid transport system permease protein